MFLETVPNLPIYNIFDTRNACLWQNEWDCLGISHEPPHDDATVVIRLLCYRRRALIIIIIMAT